MTFVTNDVDNEMNGIGMLLETRGDRIETRLQLRQESNEFLRRESHRRVLHQEVDHLHSPKISFEIQFARRMKQLLEQWRSRCAFRNPFQKFRCRRP